MIRIALAASLAVFWATSALAQSAPLTDRAAAFFDDSAVREVRLYFDNTNWYNVMVQNHQNQNQTGDPFIQCRFKCEFRLHNPNLGDSRVSCKFIDNPQTKQS